MDAPRPWTLRETSKGYWRIDDANGYQVDGGYTVERLALIVRAVNAHDLLVAALEEVEGYLSAWEWAVEPDFERGVELLQTIRAALAAAEQEPTP